VNSQIPDPDHTLEAFQRFAEDQATATARSLIAEAAKPALLELDAFRAALDARAGALAATLAGAAVVDQNPIRDLVGRLAAAARDEASTAASAARAAANREADVRLQLDRAEAQKQLDAMREEAEEQRNLAQIELRSLTEALEHARHQADAVRAERDAQVDALRRAEEQAAAVRADRDAQLEAVRVAAEQVAAMSTERDEHVRIAEAAREEARTVQGEQDALLEAARISNARHSKLIEQAQARAEAAHAQAAAAQAHAAEAQAQADAARSQLDAVRAQAGEAAQSQLDGARVQAADAQTRAETAQAQLAAAHAQAADAQRQAEAAQAQMAAAHTQAAEAQAQAADARTQAEAVQSQLAAAQVQAAEARTQADAAQSQLAAAHADADALRVQLAATQAQLVAAQAQIADAEDRLAEARAEAERRLEVGAREIEALRLELERVRADLQSARETAPAEPVQHAAVAAEPLHLVAPAVSETHQPVEAASPEPLQHVEPVAMPPEDAPLQVVVEPAAVVEPVYELAPISSDALNQAVPEPVAAASDFDSSSLPAAEVVAAEPPASAPVLHLVHRAETAEESPAPAENADPVGAMYRAITGAADLSQVLDALVDGVGALFPRAALFVVKTKSKRLQGWRSVGFTGVAAITREFEFPLTTDSALTRAVTASRTIFTGEGQPGGEAWTVTFPVTTGGRVVAVVHADGGGRGHEPAAEFDRETALDLSHTLVRMAGERIGALTLSARAAFGNVMSGTPAATPAAEPVRVNAAVAAPAAAPRPERVEPVAAAADDAGRFASQLVSELNRYNLTTAAAPADSNLQDQLAGKIEGAGSAPPPAAAPASALGMFDEALNKMLGNGSFEQASQTPLATSV
jgi:hypothetical protein